MHATALQGVAASTVSFSAREQHLQEIVQRHLPLPFIEVLADNFLSLRGPHYALLTQLAERYPIILHCVGLSIGSGGADNHYLQRLNIMADELNAIAISDHLSASELTSGNSHDLLPLKYQQRYLDPLCRSIERLQQHLQRPLIVENVSRYLCYPDDTLAEGKLFSQLHQRTGIGLLLDINNLFVTAHNLQLSTEQMVEQLPLTAVSYCHLAGHQPQGQLLLDNHGDYVCDEVWQLYQRLLQKMGPRPTIIEWDNNIPSLDILLSEVTKAKQIQHSFLPLAAI